MLAGGQGEEKKLEEEKEDDESDEEAALKAAHKKYQEFKNTCGELLDPSEYNYAHVISTCTIWITSELYFTRFGIRICSNEEYGSAYHVDQ